MGIKELMKSGMGIYQPEFESVLTRYENQRIKEKIEKQKLQLDNKREQLYEESKKMEDLFLNFNTEYQKGTVGFKMKNIIKEAKSILLSMKEINAIIKANSLDEDQSFMIEAEEKAILERMESLEHDFEMFEAKVNDFPTSIMMDEENYGMLNPKYKEAMAAYNREQVVSYIEKCSRLSEAFDDICKIDIKEILYCVWFFATEKMFSAVDFQRAKDLFYTVHPSTLDYVDIVLANLYAKKKMGGEDVLRDSVKELLKKEERIFLSPRRLTLIASGLMWMKAYKSEHEVLQYMLARDMQMPAKAQERLHSLTNGGGKAPSGFEVESFGNILYFDVSSLAWKDDEYVGMFENLAFQEKTLNYSLAIRDEDKDLFVVQGIQVPETEVILHKMKQVFADEYGSSVTAIKVDCTMLSGSGEEKMEGILVSSNECKQMGIVIHIARIGKKLIIKFYTLFMPEGSDLATQKQQALSMYKKLSPSVTMWESSLKDTMLMAVEQLLNTNPADNKLDEPVSEFIF